MNDNKRLSNSIREVSPCKDCTERFLACSDNCPKDARGEFGYKAWKSEIARVKKVRKDYLKYSTNKGYKYTWEEDDDR